MVSGTFGGMAVACDVSETGSPVTGTCVGLGSELYLEGGVAGKPIPGFDGQFCCHTCVEYCLYAAIIILSVRRCQRLGYWC